ncbi:MAG: DUF1579 domain-containing protein [Bacteroidia bacterium]
MKRIPLLIAALAVCTTSCKKETTTITPSENDTVMSTKADTTTPTANAPMESVAMEKAWKEYATPGDMHKLLEAENGKWDVTMTFWQSPGAKPQTDTSVAEAKMVMGGRYQEITYKGKMMGMDWEGKNTVAYNNKSKEFTSTFIDNSGTGMMVATGPYDAATKTTTMKGAVPDMMTGKTINFREVYTIVDDNTRKLEIFDTKEGQAEYKSMEILMKRK